MILIVQYPSYLSKVNSGVSTCNTLSGGATISQRQYASSGYGSGYKGDVISNSSPSSRLNSRIHPVPIIQEKTKAVKAINYF